MTSYVPRTIKHALLIEEADLRSLCEFILKYYEAINIRVERTDKSTFLAKNIDEVISYENPNYRKIETLTIDAQNNYAETIRLNIQSENMLFTYQNAVLEIKSEDDPKALFIADEIQKKFLEMRPGYFILATPLLYIMIAICIGVCLVAVLVVIIGIFLNGAVSLGRLSIGNLLFNTNALFCLVYIVLSPFISPFMEKIQEYLFPKVFFLLGRQKKTMEQIQKWRRFIFGTLLFGGAFSLAINLFTNLISK